MLTVSALKAVLASHRLRLTKRLGQHHLIDARIIERVVEGCALSREDTVVEIGAGLGALTERLAARAGRVIAVEIDRQICETLEARMREHRNVTVVCDDILRFSWDDPSTPASTRPSGSLTVAQDSAPRAEPVGLHLRDVVVVGAIPYHITSPIFVSLCEHRAAIRRAVLIVQQEVAQRLLAGPGTKTYGRLSVLGQYCWEMTSLATISRNAFFPKPTVDSMALRLAPRVPAPVSVESEAVFFELVKTAFSHRRKTLVNCLMQDGSRRLLRSSAEAMVTAAGLPVSVRGETLSLEQFAALAHQLKSGYTG